MTRRRVAESFGCGRAWVAALVVVAVLPSCGADSAPPAHESPAVDDAPPGVAWTSAQLELFASLGPLPERATPDPTSRWSGSGAAARLGDLLLHEPRLSVTNERACITCHDPAREWSDGLERPAPVLEDSFDLIDRNTPTLWNVGLQRWSFWDGASDTLWGASIRHIESSAVMGGTRLGLVQLVGSDDELRGLYEQAFGAWTLALDVLPAEGRPGAKPVFHPHREAWDGLSDEQRFEVDSVTATIGKAFDASLRGLISPPTRFDTFLAELSDGTPSRALSPAEQRGLAIFIEPDSCIRCHHGPALSDGDFHDVGLPTMEGRTPDWGRFRGLRQLLDSDFVGRGVHGDASPFHPRNRDVADLPAEPDREWVGRFRTPSLRRVSGTAPYMHDGRFTSLAAVVDHYQSDAAAALALRPLTDDERADLLAFLAAL